MTASPTPTPRHADTPTQPSPACRRTLPKKLHLRAKREFDAVFDARTRESRGPLTGYARPNGLPHPRLGMSVNRKVGTAVRRNRIRRLLRESFRLMQHDFPAGYDLVVVVRPHPPLTLAEYQKLMSGMMVKLHNVWRGRGEQAKAKSTGGGPTP
ncbi:MAG: Ribonuclease P protein component [uncultured Phycisphaerae bacterium]|uniref:Ribonuclease P protein component n=1 Tax=uncultured Phycisphaerae bacterium TaxID=904963 RepID=A0A6J4N1P3_9BACT|nr:MAG: Ribonuclease P protein component [uncultured Phycisphaerae bacterium]